MAAVDENHRANSYEAARKVYNHLHKHFFPLGLELELQGSVTTQTEVVKNSDIDMVVLLTSPVVRESGLQITNPYRGDITEDLKQFRLGCEKALVNIYDEVNTTGAKSIEVYPSDPRRKVDVVVAHWYETHAYYNSNRPHDKGIYIYNKYSNTRIGPDFPFLRSYNINSHPNRQIVKSMIRFMKNFKVDFEVQNLTSFQINSIAYNTPYTYYANRGIVGWLIALQDYLPNPGSHIQVQSPCGKETIRIDYNPKLQIPLKQLIEDASNDSYTYWEAELFNDTNK